MELLVSIIDLPLYTLITYQHHQYIICLYHTAIGVSSVFIIIATVQVSIVHQMVSNPHGYLQLYTYC